MREVLGSLSIDGAPPAELRAYLEEDFERFVLTLQLVGRARGAALEIGANPYFTTVLLREATELQLSLTNGFGVGGAAPGSQRVSYVAADGRAVEWQAEYRDVNVEVDRLPHPDESFDLVLFCEVIEHLVVDPVAALTEIHRVLRPGGRLIVSTPNVARLENVARLAAGANLYDPYSGYGPYGRHNREYTRHELVHLLGFCGFDAAQHFTADVHPHRTESFVQDVGLLAPLLAHRAQDLGQYIFCVASRSHAPRQGRPAELFRSMHGIDLVPW